MQIVCSGKKFRNKGQIVQGLQNQHGQIHLCQAQTADCPGQLDMCITRLADRCTNQQGIGPRLHDAHFKVMNHLRSRSKRMELHACGGESATLHFSGLRHRTFGRTGIILLAATICLLEQTSGDDNNDADISILTGELPTQYCED